MGRGDSPSLHPSLGPSARPEEPVHLILPDNVRCSFFSPLVFLIVACVLQQRSVTLSAEGVLHENKVRSVWR